MKRHLSALLIGAAATILSTVVGLAQTTYSLTDLGTLPGKTIVHPGGINNQAQVTGFTESQAFLWTNGIMTDLGTLPGGMVSSGVAINQLGQVVGDSQFTQGGAIRHATLWSGGTATDLGFLPLWGNYSRGNGINDGGEVVGHSGADFSTSNTHAFIWDSTNGMRDLGTLGGAYARANSINNSSVVTGTSQTNVGFGGPHAFLWDRANGMRDLGTLAGTTSTGNFINANGHATGTSTINSFDNREHAFFYNGTTMQDLGAIGAGNSFSDFSFGYGVNVNDEVVGSTYRPYIGGSLYKIAFVYRDGQMFDLETLVDASGADYRLYSATGINDAGQIAVDALNLSTGQYRAVLLTPNGSSTDTVTITRALYASARQTLTVQATDSDPNAVLQVYITSSDTLVGTLRKKRTGYSGKFSIASNPQNITVKSSLGGSATSPVTER